MKLWSHYKFKRMLMYKAKLWNRTLFLCTEEYTSKTCSRCGGLKKELKGERTYNCNFCGMSFDRDVNAAINIFIKNCK